MANIPLPRLSFGKLKTRSQICSVFTDDGRLVEIELPVMTNCVDDPARGWAFLLDWDDQMQTPNGDWSQILYEKSSLPICLIGDPAVKEEELEEVINAIFDERVGVKFGELFANVQKSAAYDKILWMVAIVCTTALILGFINWRGG